MIRVTENLDPYLMKFIPKDFKPYVVDIYKGEVEYDEDTKREYRPIEVDWENGEHSSFKGLDYMRNVLKEFHSPSEYMTDEHYEQYSKMMKDKGYW